MPAKNLDDQEPPSLYLESLPPEFVRPAVIARLQERIESLRLGLTMITQFGEKDADGRPNPNKVLVQMAHHLIIGIAEKTLEQDDKDQEK